MCCQMYCALSMLGHIPVLKRSHQTFVQHNLRGRFGDSFQQLRINDAFLFLCLTFLLSPNKHTHTHTQTYINTGLHHLRLHLLYSLIKQIHKHLSLTLEAKNRSLIHQLKQNNTQMRHKSNIPENEMKRICRKQHATWI